MSGKQELRIRKATKEDYQAMLELNEDQVQYLSPLTMERMEELIGASSICNVIEADGKFAGFMLVFREGADYDSVNYVWFDSHYPKFYYIDRIVIKPEYHKSGLGRAFYRELCGHAQKENIPHMTAEYYIDPPNHVSMKFHGNFGFEEVGRQKTADGKKTVSLQSYKVKCYGE